MGGGNIAGMELDKFIRLTGTTEVKIAEKSGVSQSTVNRIRNGKINPTIDILRRISDATEGAFTPNDYKPREPATREAAE